MRKGSSGYTPGRPLRKRKTVFIQYLCFLGKRTGGCFLLLFFASFPCVSHGDHSILPFPSLVIGVAGEHVDEAAVGERLRAKLRQTRIKKGVRTQTNTSPKAGENALLFPEN